jgi:hypothetical protein
MMWQVQLCMCIWKCCVFAGKHRLKGQSHNEFKGANEEFHSFSSARRNGQGAMMDHPRGLKHKDRISYKKPPYLDTGMMTPKWYN